MAQVQNKHGSFGKRLKVGSFLILTKIWQDDLELQSWFGIKHKTLGAC